MQGYKDPVKFHRLVRKVERMALAAFLLGVLLFAAWLLTGCTTTKYVPVETVHTEYRDNIVERLKVDSVTDTRFVYIKGDTVIDKQVVERIRLREMHDTLYVERIDSIAVPYPIPAQLTTIEKVYMKVGKVGMMIVIGLVCVLLARVAIKKILA